MHYLTKLSSITLLSMVLTPSVSAISLYLSVDKQAQDVHLYQEIKKINLNGYGLELSHVVNEQWSISLYGQHSDHEETHTSPPLQIEAQQHAYSASVNYSVSNYLISFSYHQLSFELFTKEQVDVTQAIPLEQFTSFEEIDSKYIELNVGRDIDFENSWLTIDVGLYKVNQQALYGSKLTRDGKNTRLLSQDLIEANSESWLIGTTLSWATLWSWVNVDFVPAAKLNFITVISGDDVYLFNTISGVTRTGESQQTQSAESTPLAGDSALIVGGSLTVLITERLYADINFNRVYANNTTDNSLSLGIGWDF